MRLFTGISIPPEVLKNLEEKMEELRPLARLDWTPVSNLHVTTKFIGQWPEERLQELEQTLARVPVPGAFGIKIAGFDFFPGPKYPRVFFAGVVAGPELADIAGTLDDALAALGCKKEDRVYSPHLTLARIRNENIEGLREHIRSMQNTDFGTFTANEFHLYLSKPGPGGSAYTRLASWPLGLPAGSNS